MTQETPTPDPRPYFEMSSVMAAIDNALRKGSYMTGANFAFEVLCDHLGVDRDGLVFRPDWVSSERAADPAVRPVDAPTAPTGTPTHPGPECLYPVADDWCRLPDKHEGDCSPGAVLYLLTHDDTPQVPNAD